MRFVFLDGPADLIASRMAARTGHYMPTGLLASQLATLEPPGSDETDGVREHEALEAIEPGPTRTRAAALERPAGDRGMPPQTEPASRGDH